MKFNLINMTILLDGKKMFPYTVKQYYIWRWYLLKQ